MTSSDNNRPGEVERIVGAIRSIFADAEIKRGAKAPETVRTKWDAALLKAEAKAKPADFFRCSACESGPWHKSWRCDGGIGPCCSGAD